MPGVSSGVRARPCDPDLAFIPPSTLPCLHCRTPLHSSPGPQLLRASSLLRARARKMTGPQEVVVEGCCSDLCLAEERVETLSSPRWRGSVLSGL